MVAKATRHSDGGQDSAAFAFAINNRELEVFGCDRLVSPAGHVRLTVEEPLANVTSIGTTGKVQRRVLAAQQLRLEGGQLANSLTLRFGSEIVGQWESLSATTKNGPGVSSIRHEEFAANEERDHHCAAARHTIHESVFGDQIVLIQPQKKTLMDHPVKHRVKLLKSTLIRYHFVERRF